MALVVGEVLGIISLLASGAHAGDFGGNVSGAFIDALIEFACVATWPTASVKDSLSRSAERVLCSGHFCRCLDSFELDPERVRIDGIYCV